MNALVSILVPIYNVEKYIDRCVRSLFEQTYGNIEYVFIDDCSLDNSMNILMNISKEYPERYGSMKVLFHSKNVGIAQTRNELLKEAKGEYCIFIDSDDYVELNAIEILYNKACETGAEIIRYNYYVNNENGNYEVVTHEPMQNKQQLLEKAISSLSGVDAMWKLFVKRNLYDRNSLQFEDGINACEDYIMSIKLFYYSNLTVDISNVLYYYTVIGNSYSYTKNYELFLVDRIKAIGAVKTFLELNDIWQTYKKALYARIIMCKQTYLINKEYFDIDKYYKLYPEANKTWRNFAYGKREILLFWLAEHKMSILIKLIYLF